MSVMHACGHDVHVTNLLASAAFLAAQRAAWSGTLVIAAQPAEEQGEGARRMNRGLLIRLGATPAAQLQAAKKGGSAPPGLHTSRFVPDVPQALRTGVRAFAALIATLLPPAR